MGFGINKPAGEEGKALPAILIGVFVAFGGILFGYVSIPNRCYSDTILMAHPFSDMILEVSAVSSRWTSSKKSLPRASTLRASQLSLPDKLR